MVEIFLPKCRRITSAQEDILRRVFPQHQIIRESKGLEEPSPSSASRLVSLAEKQIVCLGYVDLNQDYTVLRVGLNLLWFQPMSLRPVVLHHKEAGGPARECWWAEPAVHPARIAGENYAMA